MATLDSFLPYTLPELPGCDDVTVTNYLRLAATDFCNRTWAITKGFEESVTSVDASNNDAWDITVGNVVTDCKAVAVSKLFIGTTEWRCTHREVTENLTNFDTVMLVQSGYVQEKFFYFPTAGTLRIFPVSVADKLYVSVVFAPTRTATTLPDVLYDDYMEAICAGAKARLQMVPNKPWTEPALAEFNMKEFRRGVAHARMRFTKGLTGYSQSVKGQYFFNMDPGE